MPKTIEQSYPEIVKKAQELFWVNGYKSVSPEELAEHVSVSTSSIRNKYTKEGLFIDSLWDYVNSLTDPILQNLMQQKEGIESLRSFYTMLIDGLIQKTFPRSCFMVNTVVELRDEFDEIAKVYDTYFDKIAKCYKIILQRAVQIGEIKDESKVDEYTEFLLNIIFGITVLYRLKSREELLSLVDDQLSLLK